MALTGNCTNTTYSDHATETREIIIYNNDGTEKEKQTAPVLVKNATDYTNVYLCIRQVNLMPQCCTEDGQTLDVIFIYAAYESREARNQDPTNFLFDGTALLHNYNHDANLYSQIYSLLKTKEGFTNLIDD